MRNLRKRKEIPNAEQKEKIDNFHFSSQDIL
jgi:hypothetical protein